MALLVASRPGSAQDFDSGSDGSDGALTLTEPGEVVFDPTTFDPPLDPDRDNVFHFTTVTIGAGVTVRLPANKLNSRPVFWLASEAVEIHGTLDLSGENGYRGGDPILARRRPSEPGPGGFAGGVGQFDSSPAQPGFGPGGGKIPVRTDLGSDGAGYAQRGFDSFGNPGLGGETYGNTFLVPLVGGSGGGGAHRHNGAGGGAGGGALLIASSISISGSGTILASGGEGGFAPPGFLVSGGGSGGAIRLVAPAIGWSGTLSAVGGLGGKQSNQSRGGFGRIRLDAFQQDFTGTADPTPTFGSPFLVLPAGQPSVRVVSVAGEPVSPNPMGTFEMPDVTIMEGGQASVEIEARNVPAGTVVKLHLYSENGADQIVDTTPLEGTDELSTASATIEIPPGFSRSFARVEFEP